MSKKKRIALFYATPKDRLRQARIGTLQGVLLVALGLGLLLAVANLAQGLPLALMLLGIIVFGVVPMVIGMRKVDRNLQSWDEQAIAIFLATQNPRVERETKLAPAEEAQPA